MSTIEAPPIRAVETRFRWPGPVDWAFYDGLLQLRGNRGPRMLFLDGNLILMSPSQSHEFLKVRLDRLVYELVVGLEITYLPTASTTWRRETGQCGVEGDLTYYLASTEHIRDITKVDLGVDPPPDLAIEAVYSHSASHALEVYRRLGVPEVWIATERGFRILILRDGPESRFETAEASKSFPMLTSVEIADWIDWPAPNGNEMLWSKDLRRWVAETLAPRH